MAELFKNIIEPLQTSASVKAVFGEAIAAQGKTIIPVARIAYGFGGGAGEGIRKDKPGHGEGGGGGVVAVPLGVFEIREQETRFIPLQANRKILFAGLVGIGLGLLWARHARRAAS